MPLLGQQQAGLSAHFAAANDHHIFAQFIIVNKGIGSIVHLDAVHPGNGGLWWARSQGCDDHVVLLPRTISGVAAVFSFTVMLGRLPTWAIRKSLYSFSVHLKGA